MWLEHYGVVLVVDFVMPIGVFSFGVEVGDSEGATTSSWAKDCSTAVDEHTSECFSLETDVINPYINDNEALISKRSKDNFVLQTIQTALFYTAIRGDNCGYDIFRDAINILSEYFATNSTNLCESDQVLVRNMFLM